MADDIRIKSRDDLEKWLNSLPEDIRWQAATVIASRAALRVLPFLEGWLQESERIAIKTVLPNFYASIFSWLSSVNIIECRSTKIYELVVKSASDSADIAVQNATNSVAARAAASAITAATYAARACDKQLNDAITASFAAATWDSITKDANDIIHVITSVKKFMIETPLWTDPPDGIITHWNSMKHLLLAREGEHWEVWTTWYDARLDPSQRIPCYSPPDLKLEEARVLLPDELWRQGPAAVNARIRERIEESGFADKEARDAKPPDVPEQEPATIEVEWEGDRLIMRRRPVKLGDMPDETLLAALQALRQQLRQTLETLQADQSANAIDRRIIEELRQVVDLLPGSAPVDLAQLIQLAMQVDALRAYHTWRAWAMTRRRPGRKFSATRCRRR